MIEVVMAKHFTYHEIIEKYKQQRNERYRDRKKKRIGPK